MKTQSRYFRGRSPIVRSLLRMVMSVLPILWLPGGWAVGSSGTQSASTVQYREDPPPVSKVFFPQTGHHLDDGSGFLTFWRKHGGVLIFGYPISEQLVEQGQVRQYFERARFEYHPNEANPDYRVQLSRLGVELTQGRGFGPGTPGTDERFFTETGHSLSGAFHIFWRKHGGERVFGYPISEAYLEGSAVDGKPYMVQYFERARFEHHPEDMEPFYRGYAEASGLLLLTRYEVQLADYGRQAATRHGHTFAPVPKQPDVPDWSPGLWKRRIDINLTTQHLTAYESDLPVFTAAVATGTDGFNTPTGSFAIYDRYTRQTMTGAAGWDYWYVPDVPWVQYVVGGVALHGTYWHDQWGTGLRMSHGCINLNIDDAHWLYLWADNGTQVNILP